LLLADWEIKRAIELKQLTVDPFDETLIQPNGIDIRLGSEFKFIGKQSKFTAPSVVIKPHETLLCTSYERLRMPRDLAGLICLKSTFARKGLTAPTTVVDSGYEGRLTLVLTAGPLEIQLEVGQPIWYMLLIRSSPVEKPYTGKYQGIDTLAYS
jgi:dCTP deaminase